ncbi:MAG: mechanosensitive ion channel family protein [Planctomycetes bacterium]|nr:mechanosensitive ion channel family protein [Planctomycetota bacterium]
MSVFLSWMITAFSWAKEVWVTYPWVGSLLIVLFALVAGAIADRLLTRAFKSWAQKTSSDLDDKILASIHGPVVKTVVLWGLMLAFARLNFSDETVVFAHRIFWTAIVWVWMRFGLVAVSLVVTTASRHPSRFHAIEPRTFPLFDNLAKLLLVSAGLFAFISVWDFDATGWLASAGIAGIAIGFAAQDTLANLFSGVFIIADAPYCMGDYIVLDSGERGEVVHIGLRSTRLLTRDDLIIVLPNAVIGKAKVINESAGDSTRRRVRVKVGVAYGSDLDKVREVLLGVAEAEDMVCATPAPRVRFRAFSDSSLDHELLCWVNEPVLRGRALDAINRGVYQAFAENGIEIPFPQRTVHMHTT